MADETVVEMSYDEWIAAGERNGQGDEGRAALDRMDAGEPQQPVSPPNSSTGRVRQYPDRDSIVAELKAHVERHGTIPGSKDSFGKQLRNAAYTLKPRAKWSEIVEAAGGSAAKKPKRKPIQTKRAAKPGPTVADVVQVQQPTTTVGLDAGGLEEEARLLRARADVLDEIVAGIRKLAALA